MKKPRTPKPINFVCLREALVYPRLTSNSPCSRGLPLLELMIATFQMLVILCHYARLIRCCRLSPGMWVCQATLLKLSPQPPLIFYPGNILCGKIYCNPMDEKKAQKGKGDIANNKAGNGACGSRSSPVPFYRVPALAIGQPGEGRAVRDWQPGR